VSLHYVALGDSTTVAVGDPSVWMVREGVLAVTKLRAPTNAEVERMRV
jgi:hypothetical protein